MYAIMRVGVGAILMVPLVRPIANTIGGAAVAIGTTVGDTLTTVHKTVTVANHSAHRAAAVADAKSSVKAKVGMLDVELLKRESLIRFGESNEALKLRYDKLSENTRKIIEAEEAKFDRM